ncbi:MupG family TIM beta-alpha barrel fold protein [Pediococcus pentosaceus]|uniref:MupG family TIM beta-alpha barrel fold protein n=1 Tax=Pediococcus pentosaceus TaxID=1255 RepID=UPI0021C89CAB|nr:MupG family TIM beta-alpha barrel fold protein [Pediococcus pentosaceus]
MDYSTKTGNNLIGSHNFLILKRYTGLGLDYFQNKTSEQYRKHNFEYRSFC